jgi:hypothetical protein
VAGIALAALLLAPAFEAINASARAQVIGRGLGCGQRMTVVGVRGSGDPQSGDPGTDKYGDQVNGMGKPGAAFAVALANKLPPGAVTFDSLVYPAVGLLGNWRRIVNLAGAATQIGFLGSYSGSVEDGTAALRQVITTEGRVCPKVKLVLVGYSQGAQVVADVYQRYLSPSQRLRIAGVVVFGDPYFNPADTKPDVGSYDPTRHGGLGRRQLYPTSSAPIFSVCHLYDPICQGPGRNKFSQHINYETDPWIKNAANKIASRFAAAQATGIGGPGQVATCGIRNDYPILAYNLPCALALRYMRVPPPDWTGSNSDWVLDPTHAGTAMVYREEDQPTVLAATQDSKFGRPSLLKLHGAPVIWWAEPYGE